MSSALLMSRTIRLPLATVAASTPPTASCTPSSGFAYGQRFRSSIALLGFSRQIVQPAAAGRSLCRRHGGIARSLAGGSGTEEVPAADLPAEVPSDDPLGQLADQRLSNREKKELRSIAGQLQRDGKLKVHQIGRAGLPESSLTSLEDILAANELIKVKMGSNSPYELDEIMKMMEEQVGATVVSSIGGTCLVYRRRRARSALAPLVEEAMLNRKPSPPREVKRLSEADE